MDSWTKPPGPSVIAISGLIYLLLKDGENSARSITVLELGGEWMVK